MSRKMMHDTPSLEDAPDDTPASEQDRESWSLSDRLHGDAFGCEGLVRIADACKFLGGISQQTLRRIVADGRLRLGKFPGWQTSVICRRPLREYAAPVSSCTF